MRNYTESNGKIRSCKIKYCKGKDSLVYGVQQEKGQNGKMKGILHRNMLLPCEAILEDSEGFHLKKELQMKIKQEAACFIFRKQWHQSHKKNSEDDFQGLMPI